MENVGYLSLLLAFCVALYAIFAGVFGRWKRNAFLELSAQRAVLTVWVLVTAASAILVYAILTDDFRLSYVASVSNIELPLAYKFAAWWGGQAGSLLFWSWILATYAAVAVITNRRRHADLMGYVAAILMTVQAFFLLLITFVVSPFEVITSDGFITSVNDGNGLNPLLQYPAMVIHPPMLYLGYVGFAVPFAFAIASLATRQSGEKWIHTTRIWTMITWLFQSCGILLGAAWAYAVLGWGGYWGWDPVENASLLPWITGTAFLHSVMMQEKKGMLKVWNIVLVSATFFLCIFGTFLTRSGIVSSVHAFANSPIGGYFTVFLTAIILLTVVLILLRLDHLKSDEQLESVVSRESSFLFNNVLLLASCFAVLWGTLFPVISEGLTGSKVSVGAPFFNKVTIPIGLLLLFLTGVGPLFAWRRTSVESLKRNFMWPSIVALAFGAALFATGVRHLYALMTFILCAFVAITVLVEFYKGGRLIQKKQQTNLAFALVELTHRNTRRYGGYLVHMAIVLMFIGFAGSAFNIEGQQQLEEGDTFALGNYEFKLVDMVESSNPNYASAILNVEVYKHGQFLETLHPEKRFYFSSEQPTTEVAIRRSLREDVYLVFAGMSNDQTTPVMQAYVNPLVNWIWIGAFVLVIGTLIALIPSKVKRISPKTRIVAKSKKNAPVPVS